MTSDPEEFDFIVVGAGSAGCVVAAKLSEDGRYRVALIEAGGENDSFWINAPLAFGKLYSDPRFNWEFESEAEPELEGHKTHQPRGKVLGGTGSINGMIYMRGQHADYDHWRQLGNVGWTYDDVLPYFRKSEDNNRGASEYHGAGGPLKVSDLPRHELADAFVKAGVEARFPRCDDFNGRSQEGFGYNQVTIRNGRRSSSATGYLDPARTRSNLKIFIRALATRVLFKDGSAVGVEFKRDGVMHTVASRREVVLAGGVFNTPQLLQLSGVGPGDLLRDLNIPIVADVPGTGENLQDHFTAAINYRCTKAITVNDYVNNAWRRYAMGARYLMFRTGMLATNATYAGGCIRTDPSLEHPDVKIHLQLWGRDAAALRQKGSMGLNPFSSFGVSMNLFHPDSRGSVRIKSANPETPPEIRFNFFVTQSDRTKSIKAMQAIRRLMSMPAIAPYVESEFKPGAGVRTEDDWLSFLRTSGRSNHHATSSCKMGTDDKAVVDPQLRVRGVQRLRIVDGSIMPRIVAGNTNAATIMIGEKGSAIILADAKTA